MLRCVVCVVRVVAWHNDVVVGGVCCRFEAVAAPASSSAADTDDKNNKASEVSHSAQAQNRIYIMTLGVLAPYRGRGIGARDMPHCVRAGRLRAVTRCLSLFILRSTHFVRSWRMFCICVFFPGGKLLRQILEYAESHSDIADVFLHVRRLSDRRRLPVCRSTAAAVAAIQRTQGVDT